MLATAIPTVAPILSDSTADPVRGRSNTTSSNMIHHAWVLPCNTEKLARHGDNFILFFLRIPEAYLSCLLCVDNYICNIGHSLLLLAYEETQILYHLVLLDLVSTEVYFHSTHHHSGTPSLLYHPGESHYHRCRLPLTLQWFCCSRLHHWGWEVCLQILCLHTVWQHQLESGQSMGNLWYKCQSTNSNMHMRLGWLFKHICLHATSIMHQ